jgi:hypothetical protein
LAIRPRPKKNQKNRTVGTSITSRCWGVINREISEICLVAVAGGEVCIEQEQASKQAAGEREEEEKVPKANSIADYYSSLQPPVPQKVATKSYKAFRIVVLSLSTTLVENHPLAHNITSKHYLLLATREPSQQQA